MTASKHTSGPWSIDRGEIRGGEEIIGVVYRTEAWTSGEKVKTEDQANARLIAAAPELLDALVVMLGAGADAPADVYAKARAAISKATAELFPRSRATIRAALEAVQAELAEQDVDIPNAKSRRSTGAASIRKTPKRK